METEKIKEEYLKTLNLEEKETLKIAKDHLKTSFNLEKSVGYVNYIKNNSNKK
tara:strand:- start:319 stop:477 length:159 start_codon:yes stop_codon:yes gene_type:complete